MREGDALTVYMASHTPEGDASRACAVVSVEVEDE